jgi:GT2 family glycosyltransferase
LRARARNFGWRSATGEIIAFTDDDCAADPRWLESMLASARENPRAIVQGRTEPAPDEIEARGVFSRTLEVTELGPFFQTCNVAYPRVLLEELGGFDEEAFPQHPGGEDTDLALRAIARGTPAVFADEARVFHAVNELGAIGGLRLALRWSDSMAIFGRHPAIRERLHRGVFWKESHELLLRALIGIALARKLRPAVLLAFPLAFPYAKDVALRTIRSGSPVALAPYVAVQDLLEVYATVRGAIKNRVLVL